MTLRVWSLLDVLNLPIGKFIGAFKKISVFGQSFALADRTRPIECDIAGYEILLTAAKDLRDAAEEMGLTVTNFAAKKLVNAMPGAGFVDGNRFIDLNLKATLEGVINAITTSIEAEVETKVALVLDPRMVDLFEQHSPPFGADVANKFTSAVYDINEAAKCLALDRSTACVFHLMHVVELALRAVHACLGLQVPDNPSWGIWLKLIRDERVRRGDRQWPENDYFQDVYSRLDAIKDAQRDPTLHVQSIHTEEEAELLFRNTKAFMQKVASRMDEKGEPKSPQPS